MIATGSFAWTEELCLHIQEVDEQHQALNDLLSQLHTAISSDQDRSVVRQLLDELVGKTRRHFMLEESMMRLTRYADFEFHKDQHEALMNEARDLLHKLDSEGAEITLEVLDYMNNWLTMHVYTCDRGFAVHFEQSGTPPAAASD